MPEVHNRPIACLGGTRLSSFMPEATLDAVLKTLDGRRDQALSSLKELLSIPSVSTKPDHAGEVRRCATWLKDQLKFAEMEAEVMETPGHPVVVAKNKHQPGRPTILFYGHYDVQPPEPLDLWETPAFEPTVRDDKIYARGAADDKGPVWAHIEAVMAWQANGGLPCNVTLLIEGEEENASENLEHFVKHYKDHLQADICVVHDTGMFARGTPAITYGLRGLCYQEVILTGVKSDMHSGMVGGAVPNAANELCKLIATLHDDNRRVNIPGFYDNLVDVSDEEREQWKTLGFNEADFAESVGIDKSVGEAGYSVLERRWMRPTLDVNGLTSGYQGEGAKTVIPSKASAKISMRLVPGQDHKDIRDKFRKALTERCPSSCKIEFLDHGGTDAGLLPFDTPEAKLAAEAIEIGFGAPPVFIREGGTIPVGAMFNELLGLDSLFVGFGLPDDNVHAPNEKMDLDAFYHGARTAAALYDKLSTLKV